MQMKEGELNSIAPSEGLIIGSLQIVVEDPPDGKLSFWKTSLSKTEWHLELQNKNSTFLEKMSPVSGYQISAMAGGEEIPFLTKLPGGTYQFTRIYKGGWTNFEGSLSESFTVTPGVTTYIGKLVVTLPAEVGYSARLSTVIEDKQEDTVLLLAKKQGLEITNVSKKLMANRFQRNLQATMQQLPSDIDTPKYIEILRGNDNSARVTVSRAIVMQGLFVPEILTVVNDELLSEFNLDFYSENESVSLANKHIDAIAWFCNILGSSQNTVYLSTLERVNTESNNKKIKKYAKSNLERIYASKKK